MSAIVDLLPPERVAILNRWGNLMRNAAERRYVFAYLAWMRGQCIGYAPSYEHPRVSHNSARRIREHITLLLTTD